MLHVRNKTCKQAIKTKQWNYITLRNFNQVIPLEKPVIFRQFTNFYFLFVKCQQNGKKNHIPWVVRTVSDEILKMKSEKKKTTACTEITNCWNKNSDWSQVTVNIAWYPFQLQITGKQTKGTRLKHNSPKGNQLYTFLCYSINIHIKLAHSNI